MALDRWCHTAWLRSAKRGVQLGSKKDSKHGCRDLMVRMCVRVRARACVHMLEKGAKEVFNSQERWRRSKATKGKNTYCITYRNAFRRLLVRAHRPITFVDYRVPGRPVSLLLFLLFSFGEGIGGVCCSLRGICIHIRLHPVATASGLNTNSTCD